MPWLRLLVQLQVAQAQAQAPRRRWRQQQQLLLLKALEKTTPWRLLWPKLRRVVQLLVLRWVLVPWQAPVRVLLWLLARPPGRGLENGMANAVTVGASPVDVCPCTFVLRVPMTLPTNVNITKFRKNM